MKIIRDNQVLPKPALHAIATVGWVFLLYLVWVGGKASFDRTMFSIYELTKGLPEMDPFNQRYVDNPVLTILHTVPGLLFAILGPMQFASPIRRHAPMLHRLSGRIFLVIGIISGIGAIIMSLKLPIWGWTINQAATVAMSLLMIFAFVKAYQHVRAKRFPLHREWMIRGFTIGISVALFRVLLNDVLLKVGYDFTEGWNIVVWVSTPLLLAAAEFWIRVTRTAKRREVRVTDVAPAAG